MAYSRTSREDLSSAGVMVAYAFETTAGTRPTSGWTHIAGISSIPAMNESPNIINTTTLDETAEEVGVPGLKSLPSATGFTANYTDKLEKQCSDIMTKYKEAKEDGRRMWVAVVIPDIENSAYFVAEPSELGSPGADVGSVISIDLYLTKKGETKRDPKPEDISAWTPPTSQTRMASEPAAHTASTRTSRYSEYDNDK